MLSGGHGYRPDRRTRQLLSERGGVRGGQMSASFRLSVTSTAAAAVMVGSIFVSSGTAPAYSLLAEWHYTVGSG